MLPPDELALFAPLCRLVDSFSASRSVFALASFAALSKSGRILALALSKIALLGSPDWVYLLSLSIFNNMLAIKLDLVHDLDSDLDFGFVLD